MSKFIDDITNDDIELLHRVRRGIERQIKRVSAGKLAREMSKTAISYPSTERGYNEFLELLNNCREADTALSEIESAEVISQRRYSKRTRKPLHERIARMGG